MTLGISWNDNGLPVRVLYDSGTPEGVAQMKLWCAEADAALAPAFLTATTWRTVNDPFRRHPAASRRPDPGARLDEDRAYQRAYMAKRRAAVKALARGAPSPRA